MKFVFVNDGNCNHEIYIAQMFLQGVMNHVRFNVVLVTLLGDS